MQIEAGSILQGKVSGIVQFGAFVEFEDGKSGLVHISEVSDEYVEDVSKHLKVGQEVKVKVLSVDQKGKISLSIKRAAEKKEFAKDKKERKKYFRKKPEPVDFSKPPEEFDFSFGKSMEGLSFEDKLLKFKHDSDEKIQDLKRSNDSKRSGGYKRSY